MENEVKVDEVELTPEEKARRVEEFFAKKQRQVRGEEEAPRAATVRHADGTEERIEMGSVAGAGAMGAVEGAATGALKGAGRAVKAGVGGLIVDPLIGAAKLAGTPVRMLGWDGIHRLADAAEKGWNEWGSEALDFGYEDWGTKLGDAGAKITGIAGMLGGMMGPGALAKAPGLIGKAAKVYNAALPFIFGNSAAVDTYDRAMASGQSEGRALAEAATDGAINFLGFKLFANKSLNRMLKIPEMQGPMAERLTKEGIGKGIKGFESLVKAVRNGSVSEILVNGAKGAVKAGGIMGVQDFLSSVVKQYADESVKPVEEMSDEELVAAKGQIDAWEAEQAKAAAEGRDPDVELKPEWEKDVWDRLAVGLKAGLHGAGEGALMEGVMGGGELALSMKEAREQTAAAVRRLIATPKGRAFMAAQNADAMGVVEGVAREGGTLTKAQLDAAGLPPDMPMREVRRLAFELKRDGEMAERRAEMETEEYKKRAELAERLAGELEEGKELEFETEEQKAEAERALEERTERLKEHRADEMVARGQGMADTLFGEEAGVLVRRGTAAERRAAAEGAVGKGADARTLKDAEGQVCGYWDRGRNEVVLFGNADAKTVAHELGWHATRQWAERNSPELLAKMNAYAQSCPAELRAEIEAAYPDFAKNPDALLDEIGAGRFEDEMGAKFGEMLERSPEAKSWWQGLKDMIAEAWRGMVKGLGDSRIDLKALEAMTPEKGMEWLADRMIEGKTLKGGEAAKNAKGAEAQSGEKRYSRRVAAVEDSEIEKSLDAVIGRTVTREGGKAIKIKEREGEEGKIRAEAQKVFKALKDERIPLPNGGELYFAPDERTVEAYGGSVPDAWAEYCIHLVTHGVTNAETGERYRAYSEANVEKVLPAIRETVAADQVSIDRKESRIIFYRQTETGTSNNKSKFQKVVAEIDENGDVRIDLRYITGMERRGRIPGRLTTLEDALASGPTQGGATTDASSSKPARKGQDGLSSSAAGDTSKELGAGEAPANSKDGANYSTGREAAQGGAEIRPSIRGIFTGTAADYANRSREGGKDDGPSLKKIGTGEGSQVYGWGLYGSNVRGVAEEYARQGDYKKNGKPIDVRDEVELYTAKILEKHKSVEAAINSVRESIHNITIRGGNLSDTVWPSVLRELKTNGSEYSIRRENLYEQTFFTDRAPGDESHLLKWYEPVTDKRLLKEINEELPKHGYATLDEANQSGEPYTGGEIYHTLAEALGSPKAASEWLAAHDIDGVKYPVDSYGGKTLKDGDEAGWNYVSFRDDNISVDHKWTDGQIRYSRKNPDLSKEVSDSLKRNADGRYAKSGSRVVHFAERMRIMDFVGVKMNGIITTADRVRKMKSKHFLTQEQIESLLEFGEKPAAVFVDIDGKGSNVILTDEYAPPKKGEEPKPIMILLRPDKKTDGGFIASAYSRTAANEKAYVSWKGKLKYFDENKIAGLKLEGETVSQLEPQSSGDNVKTAAEYSEWSTARIIAQEGGAAQGGGAKQAKERKVTPEEDAAYEEAVKRGDMETVRRMEREVYERMGYSDDSGYQGTSAFNGPAPSRNAYFETKAERIEATKNGEMEDTTTLGDFRDGIDVNNLQFIVFDPRSERNADTKRQEAIRNIRGVLEDGKDTITMYRSVPADVKEGQFRNGDWITPSRAYAEENARIHGWEKSRIIEQEVSVEDVWWDGNDIAEWGFDDGKGSVYKNTLANRKLLGPTYDDAGNLIPLSKRFNDWKQDIRYQRKLKPTALGDGKQKYYEVKFGDAVDRIAANRRKGRGKAKAISDDMVFVSETPESLAQIGFVKLPVMMTQHHVETCYFNETEGKAWGMNGNMHGLKRTLKQLPEALKKPIMVIASESPKGGGTSVVAITRLTDADGHTVIAPVMLNGDSRAGGGFIDANIATSVHGRRNAWTKLVENAIKAEAEGAEGIYSVDLKGLAKVSPAMAKKYSTEVQSRLAMAKRAQSVEVLHKVADPGSKVKGQAEKISGQTDTRQFKNFFGDWKDDPANASKVVDENGEPLVVWHGGPDNGFTAFDPARIQEKDGVRGFYFAPPKRRDSVAGYYGHGGERAFYLNIRNPLVIGPEARPTPEQLKGHDGIIRVAEDGAESNFYNWRKEALETERIEKGDIIEIVAFEPEQVKSATDNIGTFDPENPDVRYQRRLTAKEEIERTERALKAVREGRVRVAAAGGEAGESSEPGAAAGAELLAAQRVAPSDDRSVANPVALPTSGLVGLYRALRSNPALPKVLIEAKRKGAAWVSRLTKGSDVELNPEAFGIIDETDRARIKEEMKAEGMFRDEDPVWNMKHSKKECEAERQLSEMRLEDRLGTLADRRSKGLEPGGGRVATNALAHEIGRLVMEMPMSEKLRSAAGKEGAAALKDLRTVGEGIVKELRKQLEEAGGDVEDPKLIGSALKQAVDAAAWWRGDVKGVDEYERIAREKGEEGLKAAEAEEARAKTALAKDAKGLAGELFGMFLAAPETLRERAPAAFRRIVDAMGANETLAAAYARIASADAPTEVMAKIREQWTHEAQVELRALEREIDAPLGTLWQRVKRRAILNLHSKEGAAVSIIDDALQERVAAAKRGLKVAKRGGDKAEIARAETNLEAVRKEAKDKLIDLKMGVLKKQRGGGMEREYALNVANRVMGDIARDGVELEDLRTYMKAKWCIALQGRADSFGMSPQEANTVIEGLRTRLGEADFAKLESAQRRFGEERRRAILENPDVAAAFGPALIEAWKRNADYVRSERILSAQQVKEYKAEREEWLRKNPGQVDVLGDIELMVEMHRVRHGGSDGSVFAKPLEGSFKATGDPLAYTMMHDMHILQFARRNALVTQIADMARELKMEGFKEVSDANLGRALEGSKRYGSVAFMRNGERKLLIMPKVAAEGFKSMGEGDVAGLVKANRMVSAILTQYSPRFAWRNMFRNRQAVENNIPWMRESKLQTASRYSGLGPVAKLAEHLMERAVVRLPDSVVRNRAMSLVWGENTTMYWMGEATRIAKLMFDPKAIRSLAERADAAAADGDLAAAQAIMEEIAKARDMMKKPIFAGQWRMMTGQADRADLDAVFAALDMRTNFTGERFEGLRRAARAAKDLADTVRRFNTFEEARIKIVAELAAARARNNAAAEGREFRYSQKEVDYLTATMAGSPRYEMRGRWMNVLEAIPFGPFANVGMKGAWRTVESMKTDPKAWWGKASHRIAGRMAEIALWGAGGYALVAAIARRMFGDDEEAQKAIDGFESFGKRMARARACISDYRLRNYDIVPLGLYGKWCSFGINMPRGDEDRMIMPLTDTVSRYLLKGDAAKRAGLHDPIDGSYTPVEAGVATLMDSGLAPDIYRGSMIWNLGKDTLYAWLQNPYNTFTKRNTYGQAVWENRFGSWSQAKDFFVETMKQAWNDVGGQVVVPATTWDEDAGDVPDEGKWVMGMADPKDAAEMPVGGRTIFRALHYVPMASSMLSGMFYMNCDGDARIARRLEKLQAGEKAARDIVAMKCLRMQLKDMDVAVDYSKMLDEAVAENGWDEMDRALIEQALVRKLKAAAKKMGRENVPILDVFNKTVSERERVGMERYLTGIGWEME